MSEFRVTVNDFCPALSDGDPEVRIDVPMEEYERVNETLVYSYCPVGGMEPRAGYIPLSSLDFPTAKARDSEKQGGDRSREVVVQCSGCVHLPDGFTVSTRMSPRK